VAADQQESHHQERVVIAAALVAQLRAHQYRQLRIVF
jgi:hypothetical protein